MKLMTKIRIVTFIFLIAIINNAVKSQDLNSQQPIDSTTNDQKIREVLTSQQLFVVELSPRKDKSAKKGIVNFRAELRDAFKVILYDKDTSITELDWTMFPDGACPVIGTFKSSTIAYTQLNVLMADARKNNIEMERKLKARITNP